MPTVLIDANGYPVVGLAIHLCKSWEALVFDKGADSVDFALASRVCPGDFVVTQDYGLASMCRAWVLNPNTADKIDAPAGTPLAKQKAPPCRQAPEDACQAYEGA